MLLELWKNCGNSVVVYFELGLLGLYEFHGEYIRGYHRGQAGGHVVRV